MDTALLGLRVALSLACVLGLIVVAGRRLQGSAAVRRQRTVPLSVLGRQSLGKGAGIALVEVAGRVLLLGVGEQGVRVLTEVDVPTEAAPAERGGHREPIDLATLAAVDPALDQPVDGSAEPVQDVSRPATDGAAAVERSRADDDDDEADDADHPDLVSRAPGVPQPHVDGTARLAALAAGSSASAAGALQGSVLSPDTWRRAVDVVQRRTARR
jgi:flagellar protein FliO/FliZ